MLLRDQGSWCVLQVVPRHEYTVARTLAWRGYVHFLPTCWVHRRWSDRVKVIEQPLFPGYVFCRIQQALMQLVRGTPGIIRIVSFGRNPCPIPEDEIEAIRRMLLSKREISPVPYLQAGQKVEVIAGPLAGVTGIIIRVKHSHRLVMSIDLIMKSIAVEVDCSEVALAPERSTARM